MHHELEVLREVEHPQVIPLLASYTLHTMDSGRQRVLLNLVFPLADGNLKDFMGEDKQPAALRGMSTKDMHLYLYQSIYELVSGLSFLHSEEGKDGKIITHHDLKPANILIFGKNMVFADFGLSCVRQPAMGTSTVSYIGTYEYHPPEYWDKEGNRTNRSQGCAFDVWSMGCVIVEMATLIVYGWRSKKVAEFRYRRNHNENRVSHSLAESRRVQGGLDPSFHNNANVVQDWIQGLRIQDNSCKLNMMLDIVLRMLDQEPGSRLQAWEAKLDLYDIQHFDEAPDTKLGFIKSSIPPPGQKKPPNGTETPLHRAVDRRAWRRLSHLLEVGWSSSVQRADGLTVRQMVDKVLGEDAKTFLDMETREILGFTERQVANDRDHDLFMLDPKHLYYYINMKIPDLAHIDSLLQKQASLLLRQKDKRWNDTPLHKAASMGHAYVVQKLLDYGADIEDQQKEGKTALWLAVEHNREDVVRVLLKNGAQTFTQQLSKGTPLHIAAEGRNPNIYRSLLGAKDHRKCLEHTNTYGETPLFRALYYRNTEYAEMLIMKEASVKATNIDKANILHVIVEKNLEIFLNNNKHRFDKEDVKWKNRWNHTPRGVAQKEGLHNMIEILDRIQDESL